MNLAAAMICVEKLLLFTHDLSYKSVKMQSWVYNNPGHLLTDNNNKVQYERAREKKKIKVR